MAQGSSGHSQEKDEDKFSDLCRINLDGNGERNTPCDHPCRILSCDRGSSACSFSRSSFLAACRSDSTRTQILTGCWLRIFNDRLGMRFENAARIVGHGFSACRYCSAIITAFVYAYRSTPHTRGDIHVTRRNEKVFLESGD